MPIHDHPAQPNVFRIDEQGSATSAPHASAASPPSPEGGAIRAMFIAAACSLGSTAAITGALFGLAWWSIDHDASDGGMQGLLLVAVIWFGIVILYPLLCLITLAKAPGPFRGVFAGVAAPPLLAVGGWWLYFTQITQIT